MWYSACRCWNNRYGSRERYFHYTYLSTLGETQPIIIAASDKGVIRKQKVTRQDVGSPSQLRLFLRGRFGHRLFRQAYFRFAALKKNGNARE